MIAQAAAYLTRLDYSGIADQDRYASFWTTTNKSFWFLALVANKPQGWLARVDNQSRAMSDGRTFEKATAARLAALGWRVRTTVATGDFGADVIAEINSELLVVQCKDWKTPVGLKAITEVHYARSHYNAKLAAVVSSNGFTKAARTAAAKTNVHLFSLHNMHAGCSLDRSRENARIEAALKEQERYAFERIERERLERSKEAYRALWKKYHEDISIYWHRIAFRSNIENILKKFSRLLFVLILCLSVDQQHPKFFIVGAILIGITISFPWIISRIPIAEPKPPDGLDPSGRKSSSAGKPPINRRHHESSGRPIIEKHFALRKCPSCGLNLRVNAGKEGNVMCPQCRGSFYADTRDPRAAG